MLRRIRKKPHRFRHSLHSSVAGGPTPLTLTQKGDAAFDITVNGGNLNADLIVDVEATVGGGALETAQATLTAISAESVRATALSGQISLMASFSSIATDNVIAVTPTGTVDYFAMRMTGGDGVVTTIAEIGLLEMAVDKAETKKTKKKAKKKKETDDA